MYAQGYFSYDSKKSGGITVSHLRFGKTPIQSTYLIDVADFVACHNPSYVTRYDVLEGIKEGGTFLLNSPWTLADMESQLPASMKREIASKKLKFYNIDGVKIAREVGLGGRINMCLQAAFFKIAGVIPQDDAVEYMKAAVKKTYGKKGDEIVNMNWKAIDLAIGSGSRRSPTPLPGRTTTGAEPVKVARERLLQRGHSSHRVHSRAMRSRFPPSIPAALFPPEQPSSRRRGIAVNVPKWIPENCIMCNQCSLVCPHACIRPFLAKEENLADAPAAYITKDARGKDVAGHKFRMQISPLDCTGCGNCVEVCPAKEKALDNGAAGRELQRRRRQIGNLQLRCPARKSPSTRITVIGSQYLQPLFEFSGACAGCGETPYVKLRYPALWRPDDHRERNGLLLHLRRFRAPTCPYTVNEEGHGPAWANSLFEDNAEFGYGMNLAYLQQARRSQGEGCKGCWIGCCSGALKEALEKWSADPKNADNTKACAKIIKKELPAAIQAASGEAKALLEDIQADSDLFIKKSIWIIGGDGWAYDIGYGGFDHVLAMDEDINVLVLDTEVYSNTGGQASKSSPTGAVAKFAAAGKRIKKKDLGAIAMTYGYVYVASCAMGANQAQLVKAMNEAEAYDGPSLVICYSPCINHGINMGKSQLEEKKAVEAGYWQLYRFNPALKEEGKNPFTLDSKEPTGSYYDFITGETRYRTLQKMFPQDAEYLFARAEKEAKERYENYKNKAGQN